MDTSKWFGYSKTLIGLVLSSAALMQQLPVVPPQWQPWIALVTNAALAINRVVDSGAGTTLTLLPK